ncbi:MAG: AraC family transcriptional regulator, partial [Bacteroidota bacterium]
AHCWSIIQSRQEVWKKFNASQESWTSDFQLDDLQENFLNQIKEHIENAIEPSDFSVAEVAKACALSSVTFNKKVKAITGLTAKSLIRKLQLRMAKQLLDTGNYSVAEVTYKVGFNDLNHFRNLFKATFAQTPTEYKNEKRD